MRERFLITTLVLTGLVVTAGTGAGSETSTADSAMVIPGGQEGTTLQDMTVEGEDKIRIDFERPVLKLDLDPREAPGLTWDHRHAVLDQTELDFKEPILRASARERSPYLGSPWFDRFRTAPVARFQLQVEDVENWKLTVANSRGETVAEFASDKKMPKEIPWNGLTVDGTPALPGLVYSYVFEAYDRAGNKRNFMGDAFQLPPYRLKSGGSLLLLFSAEHLRDSGNAGSVPTLLRGVAGWINQEPTDRGVLVQATARTFDQARNLADSVMRGLDGQLLGDPIRVRPLTVVEPNAPAEGAVTIRVEGPAQSE